MEGLAVIKAGPEFLEEAVRVSRVSAAQSGAWLDGRCLTAYATASGLSELRRDERMEGWLSG